MRPTVRRNIFGSCTPNIFTFKASTTHWCPNVAALFSQRTLSTSTVAASLEAPSRLALGAHKWKQLGDKLYPEIVETAVANGITTLEIGQDVGGDAALASILKPIISSPSFNQNVTLLKHVGYRTIVPPNVDKKEKEVTTTTPSNLPEPETERHQLPESHTKLLPGDVQIEEIPIPSSKEKATVVHNLSRHSLEAALSESELLSSLLSLPTCHLQIMLHNPEVQASAGQDASLLTAEQRQTRIAEKIVESLSALQEDENKGVPRVSTVGIVSNGLALPPDHPLHLSWENAVLPALREVQSEDPVVPFTTIELPLNLLETDGIRVARQIKQDLPQTQIFAMRPLTAYPDRGTGSGHPFVLSDYQLPAGMAKELSWSNQMSSPPEVYQVALQAALQHFDATEILESQVKGQELNAEQRETLDGCKLMQSLLHDVDQGLDTVRSWEAHEDMLYTKIIPLIHDTFEGYDETTASVLQRFFAAYSLAVRYSLAKNTREVLKQGEETSTSSSSPPTYPDLPDDMRLQEYALRFLLQTGVVDKLVVGCTEVDHILQDLETVHQCLIEQGSGESE